MVTISALRKALSHTDKYFLSLQNLKVAGEIQRSTLFAECRVEHNGRNKMLYMPLSALSFRRVERFITHKFHLNTPFVARMDILREEMLYEDSLGNTARCDIMLETLPDGESFADALATAASDTQYAVELLSSVKALQESLHRANLSHNNLRIENIMIDRENHLYPIRWYYATAEAGGDEDALKSIISSLEQYATTNILREGDYAPYNVEQRFDGHLCVGNMFEGLVAVEDAEGWGFVDGDNRTVIAAQYLWVNDFREGRAEVETATGMGLIDKQGRYIIPPQYDIVDYSPHKGESLVCKGGEWSVFDYFGRQLCPFGEVEPII